MMRNGTMGEQAELIQLAEANLAGRFVASMASDRPTMDAEILLQSLLTMRKSSIASKLAPAERDLAFRGAHRG